MRVKKGGGAAGHNGLRSMDKMLGGQDYWRVRLGIGHPGSKERVLGYVLGNFGADERAWLIGAAYVVVMPRWRYRVHRWEKTSEAVYTQSGWFNTERRIAPVSRIQTVDSHIGPFERLFRLANVTVTTASAAGPLKIHGLDRATAQSLVDDLISTTQATPGDAT